MAKITTLCNVLFCSVLIRVLIIKYLYKISLFVPVIDLPLGTQSRITIIATSGNVGCGCQFHMKAPEQRYKLKYLYAPQNLPRCKIQQPSQQLDTFTYQDGRSPLTAVSTISTQI